MRRGRPRKKSPSEAVRKIRTAKEQLELVLRKTKGDVELSWRKYQIRPYDSESVMVKGKSGRSGPIPNRTKISRIDKRGWSAARVI